MKVMQINCVYNTGSTGKIVYDLHNELKANGIESVVCYGRGKKVKEENVYKTCWKLYSKLNNLWSRITGIMYGGCLISTYKLFRIIKKEKPDIVHLHCLNGYFVNIYRLITFLKNNNYKTVLTLHAEFMYTANCGHALECDKWKTGCGKCPRLRSETKSWFIDGTAKSWKKMKRAFQGFDKNIIKIIAVSDWIKNRAEESGIFKNLEVQTIYNGIDISCFCDIDKFSAKEKLIKKYHIPKGKKIVLHITPDFNTPVKGGKYFLELMEKLDQDYIGIVVGKNSPSTHNIVPIAYISDKTELAEIYAAADVFVITSICDNYPTVCLEANCCGTPVVGFDVGGVKETISFNMGETVKFADVEKLKDAIICWSNKNIDKFYITSCLKKNDKKRMYAEYYGIYKEC